MLKRFLSMPLCLVLLSSAALAELAAITAASSSQRTSNGSCKTYSIYSSIMSVSQWIKSIAQPYMDIPPFFPACS